MEEILTWIVICSLTLFLYNTIKLCIIIFLILSIIYWIYKQTEILKWLKEFYVKRMNSKSSSNEQTSDDNNQQLNTPVNEIDQNQDSFSNKSVSKSSR
jgi:uncharacterized membrane protein